MNAIRILLKVGLEDVAVVRGQRHAETRGVLKFGAGNVLRSSERAMFYAVFQKKELKLNAKVVDALFSAI